MPALVSCFPSPPPLLLFFLFFLPPVPSAPLRAPLRPALRLRRLCCAGSSRLASSSWCRHSVACDERAHASRSPSHPSRFFFRAMPRPGPPFHFMSPRPTASSGRFRRWGWRRKRAPGPWRWGWGFEGRTQIAQPSARSLTDRPSRARKVGAISRFWITAKRVVGTARSAAASSLTLRALEEFFFSSYFILPPPPLDETGAGAETRLSLSAGRTDPRVGQSFADCHGASVPSTSGASVLTDERPTLLRLFSALRWVSGPRVCLHAHIAINSAKQRR